MPISLILGLILIPSTLVFAMDDKDNTFGKANSKTLWILGGVVVGAAVVFWFKTLHC